MTLTLTFIDALVREYGRVSKPFVDAPGFDVYWWTGQCPGPVAFASFADESGVEVARAQVKLASRVGEAYPTWVRPDGGVTEIELIAVSATARRRGVGTDAVERLVDEYGAPVIALAKNGDAEKFWRKQPGWEEHPREVHEGDGPEAPKGMPLFLWNGTGA